MRTSKEPSRPPSPTRRSGCSATFLGSFWPKIPAFLSRVGKRWLLWVALFSLLGACAPKKTIKHQKTKVRSDSSYRRSARRESAQVDSGRRARPSRRRLARHSSPRPSAPAPSAVRRKKSAAPRHTSRPPTPSAPKSSKGAKNPALIARRASRAKVKVKEADLYRIKGHLLFYLHTYRGLTIFNLKDIHNPRRLASVPVFGTPVEMFVEKDRVQVLVNDVLYLAQKGNSFEFRQRNTAQLVSVDISNPASPEVLHAVDVAGRLREGVSRKVGQTIYIVSQVRRRYRRYYSRRRRRYITQRQKQRLFVQSFDVSNPRHLRPVKTFELLQGKPRITQRLPRGYDRRRYLNRFVISATSKMLMVGEHWYRRYYQRGRYKRYYKRYYRYGYRGRRYRRGGRWVRRSCSTYDNYYYTRLSLIDIGDPSGDIRLHSRFEVRGLVGDQFKQTYLYDKGKNQGLYLGISQRRESSRDGCGRSRSVVRNTLVAVDINAKGSPHVLDSLNFGKPRETVRGSLFDPQRQVVYAITARRRDPLYAISFKKPGELKILSAIDGLSGDINLFRFVRGRRFLMAIGRDNSSTCKGFGKGWYGTRVAVSMIDVRNLSKIRLVQRSCMAIQARNSYSQLNRNRDQAHKMIGMYSDEEANLLTVPLYFRARMRVGRWWRYRYKSAVGLMRWNLGGYLQKGSSQGVLTNLATVIHPHGRVKRTIIARLPQKKGTRRVVLNLSANHLSLVDIEDLQKPQPLASKAVAPNVQQIFRLGRYLVERSSEGKGLKQLNIFRIRSLKGRGSPENGPVVASFRTGPLQQVIRWKKSLLLMRYALREVKQGNKDVLRYDTSRYVVKAYDLSQPRSPKVRGILRLPFRLTPSLQSYCAGLIPNAISDVSQANSGCVHNMTWLPTEQGMVSLESGYTTLFGRRYQSRRLVFLDLRRPHKFSYRVVSLHNVPLHRIRNFKLVPRDKNSFFLATRRTYQNYLSYAQLWRWKGKKGWQSERWFPLPGDLLRSFQLKGQPLLLTYQRNRRLSVLSFPADAETPQLRYSIGGRFHSVLLAGRHLYAIQRSSRRSHLQIYALAKKKYKRVFHKYFVNQPATLRCLRGGRLLIQMPRALLFADVTQPSHPLGLFFRRFQRQRYSQDTQPLHLEFRGDRAFVAAGVAGIYHLPLRLAARIARKKPAKKGPHTAAHKARLQIATSR